MSSIRVSCAALAAIIIDGKYLLSLNKRSFNAGRMVYTPFGGALEYHPKAKEFLDSINIEYERDTADLRFRIDMDNLELFNSWFNKNVDRENDISRELIEEMVDEVNIFSELKTNDFKTEYARTDSITTTLNGVLTNFFFEVYSIYFSDAKISEIKYYMENQSSIRNIILVSKEEILTGLTEDGNVIGSNTISILRG